VKNIKEATKQFLELKQKTCNESGRESSEVIVIGASKTQSIQSIRQAYEGGITNFGENYLQEAEEKISQLPSDITWHFIGAIQSKKSKKIARMFDWVHTIDRVEIAQLLNSARPKELEKLNVCVQVNLDREESKSGINLEEVDNFLLEIESLDNLNVRGLMVIPKPKDNERQRMSFKKIKNKFNELKKNYNELDTLSMGMSADYQEAIAEGSTMIRIGTNLFGPRQ
jgi:pyridoxal phosphate enzyme (YggS family)